MKPVILTLIVLSLSSFFGCGKQAGKTTASVTLVQGLATVIPGQTGGTVLLAKNERNGETFSKLFDNTPVELPNGLWSFAALSWDGNSVGDIMEGQVRCAVVRNLALNGGEENITLALSTPNCNDPLFGAKDTKDTIGEPLPILPMTCTDERGVRETFDAGTCKNSTPSSYRVIFPTRGFDGVVRPGLVSACVDEDTPTTPELDSASRAIKIPMVLPGAAELPIVIDLYDAPGCASPPDRVVVFNIYSGAANRGTAQLNEQSSNTGFNELRISKNPCTSPEGQNATPFPLASDLFAICTPDQLDNYVETNLTQNFELYADLDFTGIDFTDKAVVQGTYQGMFDGRGHTIRNVTINQTSSMPAALFREIDGDGTLTNGDANARDLTLENFTMTSSGNSNGALAGNIHLGSVISNITLKNITLSIDAAVANHGGLVGNLTNTVGNGGSFTRVSSIKAENITIENSANISNVGGIAGSMNASNELSDVIVNGVLIRPVVGSVTPAGGLIGANANGRVFAATLSNISIGNDDYNLTAGSSQIGGLIGNCNGCEVRDSKATSTIYGGVNEVGGLAGAAYGVTFSNNISDVDIPVAPSGTGVGGHIGNLVHLAGSTNVDQSRSFGSINCESTNCGGFVGSIQNSSAGGDTIDVNNSYSKCSVTSTSSDAGGFAGIITATGTGTTIVIGNASTPGQVTGNAAVGGFVGRVQGVNATVADNYFIGDLNASSGTGGGFVGQNDAASVQRNYSYILSSTGTVNSFAGTGLNGPTFANNYQIDGGTDAYATTLSLTQASTQGNFSGFSFLPNDYWKMGPSYPEVRSVQAIGEVGETFTGSNTDPIILTSPTQWNAIGDKPSLMDKVYRLAGTLDFGFGTFVPIGSVTNPFVGKLQGNNQTIQNINHVDNVANAPIGLFRKIGVASYNGPTEIKHENPFNYDEEYTLTIRNVSIAKGAGISGQAGLLAGIVQDDGSANPLNGENHDWNQSIKIGGIYVFDSTVDGGKDASASQVGGLIGYFNHTNGQSELSGIRVNNTNVYSGNQNGGTGGVIGRHVGPLNSNSTPPLREFDTFILDNVNVQLTGPTADHAGGVVGFLGEATARWEFMVVSNTTVSGRERVGGLIGDVGFNNTISNSSFVGGNVSGQTLIGGIAGNVGNSTVKGMLSKATVSSTGTGAGCIAGQGSGGGTYIIVENSVGICPSVTSGGADSYFVAIGLNTTSPTVNNVYTGPSDEGLGAKFIYLTADEMLSPTSTAPVISAGDPWILDPGFEPVPFWFVFPEVLDRN